MNILKEFDEAIAEQEAKKNSVGRGYKISDKKPYDAYMDNESWSCFVKQMRPEHHNQYNAGSGKELEPKDGKPPKMASFASSSQMIFRLSGDIEGFVFEKKFSTTVGGMANLDGYLELPDKYIFVEAKCREPYSHKAEQTIKQNYRDVYQYLREKMPGHFSCVMEDIPEKEDAKNTPKRNMRVAFFCNGKSVAYFDIKQMICHLLSVATEFIKHPHSEEILFLYFLYNPSSLQMPKEAKSEVMKVYDDTCWAANNYDFKAMFGYIVDFLIEQKPFHIDADYVTRLKNSFEFKLCDQNAYKDQLK